jgi:hypothetical protein
MCRATTTPQQHRQEAAAAAACEDLGGGGAERGWVLCACCCSTKLSCQAAWNGTQHARCAPAHAPDREQQRAAVLSGTHLSPVGG